LQEAKAIDGAYTLAFQEESTPQATTIPTVVEASHFATLQIHEGPKIFCDASVDSQNLVAGNQTGIGVLIITQPARSISHASFFQVATKQVLEPLEAEAHALLFGASCRARSLECSFVN